MPPGVIALSSLPPRFQYLSLLGACLLITLPLEFAFRARVWRRPRRLALALWPIVVLFVPWDIAAIAAGHWRFSTRLLTGWELPGELPVEEVVFFTAIPICGILTFEAVRNVIATLAERRAR